MKEGQVSQYLRLSTETNKTGLHPSSRIAARCTFLVWHPRFTCWTTEVSLLWCKFVHEAVWNPANFLLSVNFINNNICTLVATCRNGAAVPADSSCYESSKTGLKIKRNVNERIEIMNLPWELPYYSICEETLRFAQENSSRPKSSDIPEWQISVCPFLLGI